MQQETVTDQLKVRSEPLGSVCTELSAIALELAMQNICRKPIPSDVL